MSSGRPEVRIASQDDLPAIERFNERLRAGGVALQMPRDARLSGERRHRPDGFAVHRELLILRDQEEVRAGILQFHSEIEVLGRVRNFCWAQLPLSEGIVDRKYALAIAFTVREAQKRQPFQMCLGGGSMEAAWPRMMIRLGWRSAPVPFLFLPLRTNRILRSLEALDHRPRLKRAASLLAKTRAGALVDLGLGLQRRLMSKRWLAEIVSDFGDWTDEVYAEARGFYTAVVRRDATTLRLIYPPEDRRYLRIRVRDRSDARDVGWTVIAQRQMNEDPIFGDLHVGTLVDGFAAPPEVPLLVAAGVRELAARRVDLIVANFSHLSWVQACRRIGFLPGPTNFFFFVSQAGHPLLAPACPIEEIHLSRGDCDGPGRLLPPRRRATETSSQEPNENC